MTVHSSTGTQDDFDPEGRIASEEVIEGAELAERAPDAGVEALWAFTRALVRHAGGQDLSTPEEGAEAVLERLRSEVDRYEFSSAPKERVDEE